MHKLFISAASLVTDADVRAARLGTRFGRLDLSSQLALLAVESLGINFDSQPRDRIGICLAARAGSLATDFDFWRGRDLVGGPSPTLFAYTLPSAAIGEIAIRHRLTGPNLCVVGVDMVLAEARDMIQRGEAEVCLCIACHVVTPAIAELIQAAPAARAAAVFVQRGSSPLRRAVDKVAQASPPASSGGVPPPGPEEPPGETPGGFAGGTPAPHFVNGPCPLRELQENDRDIEALCAVL